MGEDISLFCLLEDVGIKLVTEEFGNKSTDMELASKCDLIIAKALEGYVRAEYGNLWETHQCRPHAFGHTWSPGYELPAGMLHGHAVGTCMGYSSYLSHKKGWISKEEMDRILKLISDMELSLWHPIMDDIELVYGSQVKIIDKRGGSLCAPVPRKLGQCGYIRSLPKDELEKTLAEYKEICSGYPRGGLGVEVHCHEVGLDDPSIVAKKFRLSLPAHDLIHGPLAVGHAGQAWGAPDALLGSRVHEVNAPGVGEEGLSDEGAHSIHHEEGAGLLAELPNAVEVLLGTAGGLSVAQEQNGWLLLLKDLGDLLVGRGEPGLLPELDDLRSVPQALLGEPLSPDSGDGHDRLLTGLEQVGHRGVHRGSAAGAQSERRLVLRLQDVLESGLDLVHQGEHGGVHVSQKGLGHGVVGPWVGVGWTWSHHQRLREVKEAVLQLVGVAHRGVDHDLRGHGVRRRRRAVRRSSSSLLGKLAPQVVRGPRGRVRHRHGHHLLSSVVGCYGRSGQAQVRLR